MKKKALFGSLQKKSSIIKFFSFSEDKNVLVTEVIAYFFVVVFIYSALRKLLDFKLYKDMLIFNLQNLKFIKLSALNEILKWTLAIIIALEVIAASLLILSRHRITGLYFSFGVMLIITIYLLVILHFDHNMTIFFGGVIPHLLFFGHLIVSMGLIFVAMAGILLTGKLKGKQ
jgi:hypothetical protein